MEITTDAWHRGAYLLMKVVNRNTRKWRISGIVQTMEKITNSVFSKDNLALIYFSPMKAPD